MPKTRVNDIELYYEIHGAGDPLVLITGLGYGIWSWFKQIPAFAQKYQVVVFDNRGVGGSDKPDCEYSIKMLADDAYALLKNLGLARAHVLGASMGGFIAQQLALDHPELVKSLILCCTSFGGKNSVLAPWGTWKPLLEIEGLGPDEIIRRGHGLAYSADYAQHHPDEMDNLVKLQLANSVPRYAWLRQFWAGAKFDLESRVAEIKAPTLIMTGSEDLLVPSENSKLLEAKIAGARRATIAGAGHVVFIERAEEFNKIVLDFLSEH
jgi:pimeloyl-ACP methyl ester carboxylesterase